MGEYDLAIHPNREEVSDIAFHRPEDISADLSAHPEKYTSWFQLAFPMVKKWLDAR